MKHEENGSHFYNKIGLKVRCLYCPTGHKYYIDLTEKVPDYNCPKCGRKRFEILEEKYEKG